MCAIIDDMPFSFCIIKILFLLLASMWSEKDNALAIQAGCGSVVSNTLISPGYPNNYPSNMDCEYVVPIADGKELKIDFRDFDVGYLSSCKDDYLKITNDKGQAFGVFCRHRTGKAVLVTGTSAVIKFHSDFFLEKKGFKLFFTPVPHECGKVVNNSLRSPGHPKKYPRNMHCVYSVNIPRDMEMKIDFKDFEMEDGPSCFCDYLKITNEKNKTFGAYCGMKTGRNVLVTGDFAVITFHSDYSIERRGFLVFVTFIPIALPKITSPAAVVRSLLNFRLTCLATGSPPMHTAIVWKSTTLINTTNTATIELYEEGNYTCVATNKHGTDVRNFLVIFNDCGPSCYPSWSQEWGNVLPCRNMAPLEELIKCTPLFTDKIDFSRNAIASLRYGIFNDFYKLKWLDLSWNAILSLPDGVFNNLTKLRGLDLSSNAIMSLPNGVFNNLTRLITLNLASNAITLLPDGLFIDQKYLEWL
ncbi:hypothetical protein ACROYT_G020211 [Oculina patagonica]